MPRHKDETAIFKVTVKVPVGANMQDCENYIRTAVQSYVGGTDPESPIYNLDPSLVRVTLMERRTVYVDTGNERRTTGKPSRDPTRNTVTRGKRSTST